MVKTARLTEEVGDRERKEETYQSEPNIAENIHSDLKIHISGRTTNLF